MFGYIPDIEDARDERFASAVVYKESPNLNPAMSLRPFKKGFLYQNGYGACVAFSLARVLHMSLLLDDARNGRPLEASMPSPGFLYYNGRRQESVDAVNAGLPAIPVTDKGTRPRLMMSATQKIGYCREQDYPFASMAQDIDGFPSDNRAPPPRTYMQAFDQRNLRYSRVYQSGRERKEEVQRLYRANVPVLFAMSVDGAFMQNRGAPISTINLKDKVGGHMMALLETPEEGPVLDNWWGDDWGNHGEGQLTWDLFGSDIITDVYAVEAAPAFSSEAP